MKTHERYYYIEQKVRAGHLWYSPLIFFISIPYAVPQQFRSASTQIFLKHSCLRMGMVCCCLPRRITYTVRCFVSTSILHCIQGSPKHWISSAACGRVDSRHLYSLAEHTLSVSVALPKYITFSSTFSTALRPATIAGVFRRHVAKLKASKAGFESANDPTYLSCQQFESASS